MHGDYTFYFYFEGTLSIICRRIIIFYLYNEGKLIYIYSEVGAQWTFCMSRTFKIISRPIKNGIMISINPFAYGERDKNSIWKSNWKCLWCNRYWYYICIWPIFSLYSIDNANPNFHNILYISRADLGVRVVPMRTNPWEWQEQNVP